MGRLRPAPVGRLTTVGGGNKRRATADRQVGTASAAPSTGGVPHQGGLQTNAATAVTRRGHRPLTRIYCVKKGETKGGGGGRGEGVPLQDADETAAGGLIPSAVSAVNRAGGGASVV